MACADKHTKFQPTKEQWLCPSCGADNCYFTVDCGQEGVDESCELLHVDDEVGCTKCGGGWDGKEVAELLAEKYEQSGTKGKPTMKKTERTCGWKSKNLISRTMTDTFYVLRHKKTGEFYYEMTENNGVRVGQFTIPFVNVHGGEVWAEHDKSRLEFMKMEYDRLKDFEIVEVTETKTVEYSFKKA
jgi:hypothetical protein